MASSPTRHGRATGAITRSGMTAANQHGTTFRRRVLPEVTSGWPVALALFLLCPILRGSDLLLIRGRIYTGNPRQPWASALAITGSRIDAVGETAVIQAHAGAKTRVIDLAG